MYGVYTGRAFRYFVRFEEALAFAYRSLLQKKGYTIYDVYRFPESKLMQIKQDIWDDSGGDDRYRIGVCWSSEIYPPQYESIKNTEKRSRTILASGKLMQNGWKLR